MSGNIATSTAIDFLESLMHGGRVVEAQVDAALAAALTSPERDVLGHVLGRLDRRGSDATG